MSYVAEFRVEHEELFLIPTLDSCPDAKLRHSYTTDVGADEVRVFVHVAGECDRAAFEAALDDDPTAGSWTCIFDEGEQRVYSIEATPSQRFILRETAAHGIYVTSITGEDGNLFVTVRLPSRRLLSTLRDIFENHGVRYQLEYIRVYDGESDAPVGLTEAQLTLLEDAFYGGYFEVPRRVNQAGLAEKHGITESAVSQQLRRALNRVVESVLRDREA